MMSRSVPHRQSTRCQLQFFSETLEIVNRRAAQNNIDPLYLLVHVEHRQTLLVSRATDDKHNNILWPEKKKTTKQTLRFF